MNIGVHVSLLKILRFSLNRCPRVRLQDYIIALFLVFEKLHPFLHSGCITLHSTDSVGGLLFIHILSSIYYLLTLMMAILTAVRWNFIVVLICISLLVILNFFFSSACWPSVCLLWRNVYLRSAHFLIHLFVHLFLLLNCMNSLYILQINLLPVTSFANIFSHSVGLCFHFVYWFPFLCKTCKFN